MTSDMQNGTYLCVSLHHFDKFRTNHTTNAIIIATPMKMEMGRISKMNRNAMITVLVFVAFDKFRTNHTNIAIIIATPMKMAISKLIPCKYVKSPVLR